MSLKPGALFVESVIASAADLDATHRMIYAHRINEHLSEIKGPAFGISSHV